MILHLEQCVWRGVVHHLFWRQPVLGEFEGRLRTVVGNMVQGLEVQYQSISTQLGKKTRTDPCAGRQALSVFQGSFAAHSTCKGLGNFKLSCAAKGFVGSIVTAGNEAEELVQGKSSLTALHANGCSAIMERMFVDSEGKQNKYLVSCYYEDPDGEGDGIFDDDDGKLMLQ